MTDREKKLNEVADTYKGLYRKAFFKGFDHAVEGKGWGFGEHTQAEVFLVNGAGLELFLLNG